MDLCYFDSAKRNFGDDLNPYILEHFIPNYNDVSKNEVLYFIGTILFDGFVGERKINNFQTKNKIVFGSGVRFINKPPKMNGNWDVKFLRGPLSSLALMNNSTSYITDPAYLVKNMPWINEVPAVKKYKISLMPHFLSLDKLDWKGICEQFGINFINPSEENIDFVLSEVAQSEMLITEAMHGAIIADALRVPWKRITWFSQVYEREMVSEFKWSDWLFSMGLKHDFYNLPYNRIVREIDRRFSIPLLKFKRNKDIETVMSKLLDDNNYQLSSDKILDEKMEQLLIQMDLLKKQISK